ncbi:plasmid segregation protein ParM [Klebsiella aerogenes]|nr:plasmid segregation protein ParM [Klebsiella aerogenes]
MELTVTLPFSEFYTADCQKNTINIERKISNLMREVTLNKGTTFIISVAAACKAATATLIA